MLKMRISILILEDPWIYLFRNLFCYNFTHSNSSFSIAIYIEIAVLAFFFGISQGVLSLYIPGLFPVAIRGTATGFCFNIGRLVTATAVLFVGILVTTLGGYGNSLFIFSLVFVVGLVATFFAKHKEEKTGSPVKEKVLQPQAEA